MEAHVFLDTLTKIALPALIILNGMVVLAQNFEIGHPFVPQVLIGFVMYLQGTIAKSLTCIVAFIANLLKLFLPGL